MEVIKSCIMLVLLATVLGGCGMESAEKQVADDAVKQYEIVKRNGDPADICVHAGLVSAAYAQSKDEENYKKWKEIERAECKSAGMP